MDGAVDPVLRCGKAVEPAGEPALHAGRLDSNEVRLLGERIISFCGFDVRRLVEQAILDLVLRRRQAH